VSRRGGVELTMLRWRWVVVMAGLGLYMVAVGFLGARPVDRLDVEEDAGVLSRVHELNEQLHAWLGTLRSTPAPSEKAWTAAIRGAADALVRGELAVAERSLEKAYAAAGASRSWEALLEVGDAQRRLGELGGAPVRPAAEAKAAEAYRAGLVRAWQQGAVDGVLRAAEAFDALGDQEAAALGLRMAEALAARNPEAQADVRAVAARLAHQPGDATSDDETVEVSR
jgi:hypothetical protein